MKRLIIAAAFLLSGCMTGHYEWDSKAIEYANWNFIGVPTALGIGAAGSSTPLTESTSVTNKHVAYPLLKNITKKSNRCDIAVISQNNKGEALRDWAIPKVGDNITIHGYSAITAAPVSSNGKIVKFVDDGGCVVAFTTAGGVVGMSGGPVVNEKGQLVGVLYAFDSKTGLTAFVPYQSMADVMPISIRDKTRSAYYANN